MNNLWGDIGSGIFLMGIIFTVYGLYCMNHRPIGEATQEDIDGSGLYPIGVGMIFLGMIFMGAK